MSELCICGSGKPGERCCDRFLLGGSAAKTPEQLMRSRYAAYAKGGFGAYLLETWEVGHRPNLSSLELSKVDNKWLNLNVLSKSQKGDQGLVEFKAYFKNETGDTECHHEKSIFQRIGGLWFYVRGEIIANES